jgi:voltage-gated potassium channel
MSTELTHVLGLAGVGAHESAAAQHWEKRLHWPLVGVLLLTIPAFYLELVAPDPASRWIGWSLYLLVAIAFAAHSLWMSHVGKHGWEYLKRNWLDVLIAFGALMSLAGTYGAWSPLEWVLRLTLVGLILVRLLLSLRRLFSPSGIAYVLILGAAMLALAGAGFYWLEPTVKSYADGLWLAFESGATVGYGDIVPTTAASRVFAVFMVLLGYAVMSLVTASIAAIFVGEDEQRLRRELHRDIRELRREVEMLRKELRKGEGRMKAEG